MKKSQLRNIIKELIKEQSSGGWTGTWAYINFAVVATACRCDNWDDSTNSCNGTVLDFGDPGGQGSFMLPVAYGSTGTGTATYQNPVTLNVGDIVSNVVGSPQQLKYKIMTVDPWICDPNDPNVNGNPALCQGGGSNFPMQVWPAGTPCGSGTTTSGCTDVDFDYNSNPCGQTHLVPAPGGQNSWSTWLNARANGYQSIGCQHLQNIINWTQQQLTTGVNSAGVPWNLTQVARKQAKIDWAGCMLNHCSC